MESLLESLPWQNSLIYEIYILFAGIRSYDLFETFILMSVADGDNC